MPRLKGRVTIGKKKRLLYFCSYVPVTHLESMGFEMFSPGEIADMADDMLQFPSRAVCSYMQQFGKIDYRQFDGIIFTHCCSSSERLYDYIQHMYPDLFMYILDIPGGCNSEAHIKSQFLKLFHTLNQRFGGSGEPAALPQNTEDNNSVWIVGSGVHPGWLPVLEHVFGKGACRFYDCLTPKRGDLIMAGVKTSCPHMLDFIPWFAGMLENKNSGIKAVVGFVSQKCDYGLFSMPLLQEVCETRGCRFLQLEEEFTRKLSERNLIRLEAFHENIKRGE